MGIVDCLSREPNKGQWPESELDEKFAVKAIKSFHSAPDCLNSRLNEENLLSGNENNHEYSRHLKPNRKQNTSSLCCYSNQNVQNWTELDRKKTCLVRYLQNDIMLSLFKTSLKLSIGKCSCQEIQNKRRKQQVVRRNLAQ